MIAHRNSPQHGFSNLEIIVGLVIFLLAVSVVAANFTFNSKASRKNDGQIQSLQIATQYLEKAKTELGNPGLLSALLAAIGPDGYEKNSTDTLQGKVYRTSLKYKKLSPSSNLMSIKAIVTWDAGKSNFLGTVHPFGS